MSAVVDDEVRPSVQRIKFMLLVVMLVLLLFSVSGVVGVAEDGECDGGSGYGNVGATGVDSAAFHRPRDIFMGIYIYYKHL